MLVDLLQYFSGCEPTVALSPHSNGRTWPRPRVQSVSPPSFSYDWKWGPADDLSRRGLRPLLDDFSDDLISYEVPETPFQPETINVFISFFSFLPNLLKRKSCVDWLHNSTCLCFKVMTIVQIPQTLVKRILMVMIKERVHQLVVLDLSRWGICCVKLLILQFFNLANSKIPHFCKILQRIFKK